ncbi:microfibril-associated glycoprotein 4 isoform X1 [Mesoplodon densirostris]|uniref:microfibril-associated glycoprotein 4 isoform X1 n=1 Tax=Mesoplodon densirostris TaxID=48708 RepID=UPI0028DCF90E|nr:microfibril-associated glycoprotein 4 isoform X1 [Mesoplodon densirostris]
MKALLALSLLLLLCTGPCVPQVLGIRGDALERSCLQQPLDCDDIYAQGYQEDGVYLIYPSGPSVPVPVFCDMTTEGGKWTVFQKRFNGSVSFFRGWNDYKLGFGRADGEYWLGLQNLHLLTLKQKYELRVDLEDFENNTAFAKYAEFSISPNAVSAEEDGYSLHVSGFEDGGAGTRSRQPRRGWGESGLPPHPGGPASCGRTVTQRLARERPRPQAAPPLRQATPCPTTAARSSPPSTGTRTSSCRTARPSRRAPSGSAAATSPTSTASTSAAPTSPTPTASTGPSGRASITPSSAPR